MSTTFNQKQLLIQWMKLHPDVARGRLRRKGQSRHEMKELLEELAGKLNSLQEGPVKIGAEWFKTWKDWKNYILKKETKRRSYCNETRGGPPLKMHFSPIEEEVLEFLTPEAVSLENIPQGGIYVDVSGSDSSNVQEILENIENVPPPKKPCNSETLSHNFTASNIKHVSAEMVQIQKEKLILKKEEVHIQRQLLETLQSMLAELKRMANVMDTFGTLT